MKQKNINDVSKEDLVFLIINEILESKSLDYKKEINLNTTSDKQEFLADISSFANANGGDLIIGIEEKEGLPFEISGLDIAKEDIDSKTLQIEDLIRQGIEPRIPDIQIKFIEIEEQKHCLIIRVGKSWTSPHWVSLKGHKKFYARSSNGKYQLDIDELRNAFVLSESLNINIKQFRTGRISNIIGNEMPVLMQSGAKIIVHLIPLSAFGSIEYLDIKSMKTEAKKHSPLYCSAWNYKINFEGFLLYSASNSNSLSYSYTQFYRNGIIEMVNSSMLDSFENDKIIPSILYEREIIKEIKKCVNYYRNVNISAPIFVFVSLVGVKGYKMAIDTSKYWGMNQNSIDRDMLLTPEAIIDNFDANIEKIMKTCFDFIWNACGFEGSLNFDENDKWIREEI